MLSVYAGARCRRLKLAVAVVIVAAVLFYASLSLLDHCLPFVKQNRPRQVRPRGNLVGQGLLEERLKDESYWQKEYNGRVERVRRVCEKDEIAMMRRIWRVAANRRWGKDAHCKTKTCPIIIDEKKVLFFCFIPKVASTRVKEFFLNISDIPINETVRHNNTALHLVANNALKRISPMYYPATTARRFFKIIFVRHPFERLVSAFRTKAEGPREELWYFYETFWDKVMRKLRPNATLDESSRITFREFVWYLIHYLERDYDEHWAPYWSRCDPCLIDYDFVGKLETAEHDFPYAFDKVGISTSSDWWKNEKLTNRRLTLEYFSQVPPDEIKELYKIYRLDFELFGYSLEGFVDSKSVTATILKGNKAGTLK